MWLQKVPGGGITALAFAPDGRALYSGDAQGRVIAWDVVTQARRELYRRAKPVRGNRGVHNLWSTSDGARLLFTDDRALVDALRPDAPALLSAGPPESWGWWKCLLPDGRRVTSVEPEWRVGLWDLTTGVQLPVPGALGAAKYITHHDLLPDGRTLLTYQTTTRDLVLWDFHTGERVGHLGERPRGIKPCARATDGGAFAVGCDKTLWVYDVPARAVRHRLTFERSLRELAFHPNGRLLASAATTSAVALWDATTGERLTQFDWTAGKVTALAFAPDGLTCAVGSSKGEVALFDVDP